MLSRKEREELEAEYKLELKSIRPSGVIYYDDPIDVNDKQVDGKHYQKAIQPWDYIIANDIPYMEGNVIKYITRWKDKGGVKDLEKAKHYIEKLIEVNK